MQRSYLKYKKVKNQIKSIKETWRNTYKNTYEEGLHFLIEGLQDQEIDLDNILLQIKNKVPIQYILQKWFFYDGEYFLNKHVLIPRPETEVLVDFIIKKFSGTNKILDLGTGSGCIAIELSKKLIKTKLIGTDISKKALEVANRNNSQSNNPVNFFLSDWFSNINEVFDLIIANPPYLAEYENLDKSLLHEPKTALVSKNDGFFDLEHIISEAPRYLSPNGALILEHGIGQEKRLKEKMLINSYKKIELIKDLKGINRFILGFK